MSPKELFKKSIILIVFILAAIPGICPAQDNNTTLISRVVTVPAGVSFRGIFLSPVNSETAVAGQEVSLAMSSDFYYRGKLIAPAGSQITGTIIDASGAKHGSVSGKLSFRFTSIVTPSGTNIPISAIAKTEDKSGVILGSTKFSEDNNSSESEIQISETDSTSKVGLGRGITILNEVGLSGGGLLKSIWDKGDDVDIPINTALDLILTQPITVRPSVEEN